MNSRWFYILLANIAVLSVNIWLFVDKPQSDPDNVAVSPSAPLTVQSKDEVIFPATPLTMQKKDNGISPINGFYFLLNEPLAVPKQDVTQQDLKPQLSRAQKTLSQQNNEIKKVQQRNAQQSKKIARLQQQNNKLHRQLFLLDAELDRREEKLVQNKQTIQRLEIEKELAQQRPFKTDVELVKKSIQSKPDLVKLKPAKQDPTQSTAIEKELLVDEVEKQRFSGSVEFGFTYEQDNQVTKGVIGRLVLDYDELEQYNINSDLDFEFENEDGETSTDKYRWQLQADYNLDLINLVFARSDLSRSKFSSYEQEDIFTVGYGRIFFNTNQHKFNIEVGPGYRFAVPNVGKDAVSIDELIVRTRLNYERIITDSLQVQVDTVIEAGHSNSVYSLNFKAQNRIYQELYLIFDFEYKYTENVPIDTVNKEVASGLSLLYAF